jgi:hypothetical protein
VLLCVADERRHTLFSHGILWTLPVCSGRMLIPLFALISFYMERNDDAKKKMIFIFTEIFFILLEEEDLENVHVIVVP